MGNDGLRETVVLARGARAKVIREGLKAGMENDAIVTLVFEQLGVQNRKKVQTQISRYRNLYGQSSTF